MQGSMPDFAVSTIISNIMQKKLCATFSMYFLTRAARYEEKVCYAISVLNVAMAAANGDPRE